MIETSDTLDLLYTSTRICYEANSEIIFLFLNFYIPDPVINLIQTDLLDVLPLHVHCVICS